jgi:hypothetical protein
MEKVASKEFLFFLGHLHTKIQSLYTLQKLGKISFKVHKGKWNNGCVTLWPCHLCRWKHILRRKKTYENSNISPCKNIIVKKYRLQETKILQDIIYNSIITNLEFQQKPKNIIFQNSSYKTRPIYYYLGGQNPLKLPYSINESKHNISFAFDRHGQNVV